MNQPALKYLTGPAELSNESEAFAYTLGPLLGDAGMKKLENRLCIEQSDFGYTEWKKRKGVELGVVSNNSSISTVNRTRKDPITGKVTRHKSYRFYTRSLFSEWHQPFYVVKSPSDPTFDPTQTARRRKRFPIQLVEWFTHPLALAIFYMDDGGVQDNQAYLSTGEVPLDEVNNLQRALEQNFGLETTIRYAKGVAVGLLVRRKNCARFIALVKPYVRLVPSMGYKLNIS